ncbi:MAG: hypothetical protein WCF12_07490 [Propionicimonas sp.]
MPEEFEREQAAFRAALRSDLAGASFAPLDPADVVPGHSRRSGPARWVWAGAAAALLSVVVAGVLLVSVLRTNSEGSMTALPAGAKAEQDASGEVAPPVAGATLAEPAPGFRWESFRNVVVQVPTTWGYAHSPQADWCAEPKRDFATAAFVDLSRGRVWLSDIRCAGEFPASRQGMHLSFLSVGEQPDVPAVGGWTYSSRVVGEAGLWVLAPPEERELANRILESGVVVPSDHNGCSVEYPRTTVVDLQDYLNSELTVCLYDRLPVAGVGLLSSVRISGDVAVEAWRAILAAPAGGGPDGTRDQCNPTLVPVVSAVLLVGGQPVTFGFAGCTGNGLVDAGAAGGLRQVTGDLCRALIRPPVWVSSTSGPAGEVCLAGIQPR